MEFITDYLDSEIFYSIAADFVVWTITDRFSAHREGRDYCSNKTGHVEARSVRGPI
jgi:hypothetical protein